MKLLFYSYSTTSYGAPTSMLNLIAGLSANKEIRISVVVPNNGPLTKALRSLPVKVVVIPFSKWVYSRSLYERKLRSNWFLAKIWFYKNLLSKALLNLFFLPVHLYTVRGLKPDVIYTNSSLSPMGVMVARILRINSVWHHRETINDPVTDFFIEWPRAFEKRILNFPDVHLYASSYLLDSYRPYLVNGKNVLVTNGVEAPGIISKSGQSGKLVLGMVGRLNQQKGQESVINILNDFPELSLHLYGAGEKFYIDRLRLLAKSNIQFRGFKDKESIYREIDYLIVNARNESFGRVVAEAFGYGVPVIAIRSGALPELMDDGVGFLFGDDDELRSIVAKVAKISRAAHNQMSERCVERYNAHFSIAKYCANILDTLKMYF
jgi:L-malate glycosyltransferase